MSKIYDTHGIDCIEIPEESPCFIGNLEFDLYETDEKCRRGLKRKLLVKFEFRLYSLIKLTCLGLILLVELILISKRYCNYSIMQNENLTADQREKLTTFVSVYPMEDERALQFLQMCDFNLEVTYFDSSKL
jgi:UBA-like domain